MSQYYRYRVELTDGGRRSRVSAYDLSGETMGELRGECDLSDIPSRYLFSVELDLNELSRNKLLEKLREQFREHDEDLTPQARIKEERIGKNWTIVDGDKQYFIRNENQTLNVYSSRIDQLVGKVRRGSAQLAEMEELGESLFETLFSPEVAAHFLGLLSRVVREEVFLLLELDLDEAETPQVAALPWEFLRAPETDVRPAYDLSTHPKVVLSRRRMLWESVQPIASTEILRIQLVISAPTNKEEVVYREVEKALEELPDKFKLLETLHQPDEAKLERVLEERQPHILHFIGHGRLCRTRAELALVNSIGYADWLPDTKVGELFQAHRPQVVFFQACESGAEGSADAFVGVASQVVQHNVPVVVAMQYPVDNNVAVAFAEQFYRRWGEGEPVGVAVQKSRRSLSTKFRDKRAFAAPVLFMRHNSVRIAELDERDEKPPMFWENLIGDIGVHKCTPIIGPRVHGRWLPRPEEMARCLAKANNYPFAGEENLARVTQYLNTKIGGQQDYDARHAFLDELKDKFNSRLPEEQRPEEVPDTLTKLIGAVGWKRLTANDPNETHQVLAKLGLPLYMTTNYDSFMYEALAAEEVRPVREICRWNGQLDELPSWFETHGDYELSPEEPMVYHLFGSDVEADSLVLTEDHYCNFLVQLSESERIPYTIHEALAESTLLFIGYGIYDWEFRVLMHALSETLQRRLKTRLETLSKGGKDKDIVDIAVQLEFKEAGGADKQKVKDFLQKYFGLFNVNIDIFWGSTTQFMVELREHWEAKDNR